MKFTFFFNRIFLLKYISNLSFAEVTPCTVHEGTDWPVETVVSSIPLGSSNKILMELSRDQYDPETHVEDVTVSKPAYILEPDDSLSAAVIYLKKL